MVCKVQSCLNYEKKNCIDNGDCILQLLDFIKLHYYHLQTELNEKSSSISQLEKENLILNKAMDNLRLIQSTISSPAKRKKRKNSSEPPDSTILSTSNIFPRAILNINDNHNTTDDLNIALNSNVTFEDSCDAFMSPVNSINLINTPKKEENTLPGSKRLPLSPINNKDESVNGTPVKKLLKEKRNRTPVKLTPTKISQYLPKRIVTKETPSGKKINADNAENKVTETGKLTAAATTANWLTSTDWKKKGLSLNKGLGFIQPVKHEQNNSLDNSCESIASSQTIVSKASNRKDRNILNLKTNPKMRQAKLEFDRKKMDTQTTTTQIADDTKLNSTVCDEIVCASPSNVGKNRNLTQKSLRKLSRKKSDDELFNISIKKSTSATSAANGTKFEPTAHTSTPEIAKIKEEPETIKKPHVTNLFPSTKIDPNEPLITEDSIDNFSFESELFKNDEKDMNKDKQTSSGKNLNSSSLVILPSQPDDVIIVEETETNVDFANIDSDDLFKEIMQKGSQTPAVLKQLEKGQIKYVKLNNKSFKSNINNDMKLEHEVESDGDITQLNTLDQEHLLQQELEEKHAKKVMNSPPLIKIPITLNSIGHNCDCRNCNSYLRYLIALNIPRDEIKVRMKQNTKHAERPLKLHLTPEGFWDPIMRDFPPGDPRNEVIIDRRFVDKNQEFKKEN